MYQNLFSLDYIVNDEKKSVLMSVLNEDFIRMNRERIISSLRAFLSQIDDDAIDEKEDIFFLFFFLKRTRQSREPIPFYLLPMLYLKSYFQKTSTQEENEKNQKQKKSTHTPQTEELLLVVVVFLILRTVLF